MRIPFLIIEDIKMKQKVNVSLDNDTVTKLKEIAEKSHKSVSQWISDKVWETAERENEKSVQERGI